MEILRRTPWSRIKGQNSVDKEVLEIVGNVKPTGNVWKETIAVPDTIWISVKNRHSRIFLQDLLRSRVWKMRREREVPEARVPVVECLDGPARITSEEFAITHHAKNGTLQNVCTTCSFAHRQVDEPTKRSKTNDDKSAVATLKKGNWQERESVTSECHEEERWWEIGTKSIKTSIFWCTAIGLRISGHDAAEVYSPEGHWHAEANPTCVVHKGCCTSYQNSRPKSLVRLHLSRWTSWAWPQHSEISWIVHKKGQSGKSKVPAKQRGSWPKVCQI